MSSHGGKRLLTVVLDFASFNQYMKTNSALRSYFQAYTYLGKHLLALRWLFLMTCLKSRPYGFLLVFCRTGKSVSEALILESVNPQYDKRLFIEFPKKDKFTTCCVQILFWMSKQKQKNNFCTQHVVNLYFSWNSMNNLSSYCGLTDARMRASEKDYHWGGILKVWRKL